MDHAVSVEERAIESDAMAHHFQEPVAVLIKRWNDRPLEFIVEGGCIVLATGWRPGRGVGLANGTIR